MAAADAIVPQILPFLDRPFALFGHCMGAIVMYEVAQRLEQTHGRIAAHLFASGCMAPHLYNSPIVHEQEDAAFLDVLRLEHLDFGALFQFFLRRHLDNVAGHRLSRRGGDRRRIRGFGGRREGNQFHLENQRFIRSDLPGPALTVGQFGWDDQLPLRTGLHPLQSFGPAFDDMIGRRRVRLVALVGTVELRAVDQRAAVVDCHDVV